MQVKWLMGVDVGRRVLITRDLDFEPFFTLPSGSTGTVVFVNPERGVCAVRLDQPIEGAEAWDNEVYFNVNGALMPQPEWYTLELVAYPLPNGGNK